MSSCSMAIRLIAVETPQEEQGKPSNNCPYAPHFIWSVLAFWDSCLRKLVTLFMSTHREGVRGCASYLSMVLVFYPYHILITGQSPALDPLERTMGWAIFMLVCGIKKGSENFGTKPHFRANYSKALCPNWNWALLYAQVSLSCHLFHPLCVVGYDGFSPASTDRGSWEIQT